MSRYLWIVFILEYNLHFYGKFIIEIHYSIIYSIYKNRKYFFKQADRSVKIFLGLFLLLYEFVRHASRAKYFILYDIWSLNFFRINFILSKLFSRSQPVFYESILVIQIPSRRLFSIVFTLYSTVPESFLVLQAFLIYTYDIPM